MGNESPVAGVSDADMRARQQVLAELEAHDGMPFVEGIGHLLRARALSPVIPSGGSDTGRSYHGSLGIPLGSFGMPGDARGCPLFLDGRCASVCVGVGRWVCKNVCACVVSVRVACPAGTRKRAFQPIVSPTQPTLLKVLSRSALQVLYILKRLKLSRAACLPRPHIPVTCFSPCQVAPSGPPSSA